MENNNSKFIKAGENVMFKYSTEGLDYNLESGKVYTLQVDCYTDQISLKISTELALPEKIYVTSENDKFIKKVLDHHTNNNACMTGVMLSGLKGSGKSVLMKQMALQSNLPIILIDKGFRPCLFKNLFNLLKDIKCCFIFDEIDKLGENYDDTYLLSILDGAATTGNHLMIFTCNDEDEINDCLIDRCSRIRYWKKFSEMSNNMIVTIIKENLNDTKRAAEVASFVQKNFRVISFDNVLSFVNEINDYPNDSLEELFKDMNLSKR